MVTAAEIARYKQRLTEKIAEWRTCIDDPDGFADLPHAEREIARLKALLADPVAPEDRILLRAAGFLGHRVIGFSGAPGSRHERISCSNLASAESFLAEGHVEPRIYVRQPDGWNLFVSGKKGPASRRKRGH